MTKDELIEWLVEHMTCDGCPLHDECYSFRKNTCETTLRKYFGLKKKSR
jgi:hypothetical protein